MKKTHKILYGFLGVHFLLWTLVGLIRKSIAMDSAEAIVWGGEWIFGTDKHPYLSGWIAELFHLAFPFSLKLSMAIAAATCTTIGLYFTYRLAREFLDEARSLIAALLLEGCVYYAACALEYNCNMLSVVLVPLFLWTFHYAIRKERLWAYLVAGIAAGALVMTKYTNGTFLLCAAVYTLCYKREVFKSYKIYLAVVLALLLCVPHLYYLISTNFVVFTYFEGRSQVASAWYGHLLYPLKFFGAQLVAIWGILLGFGLLAYQNRFKWLKVDPYLVFTGLGPLAILLVISALGGISMKSMWGYVFVGVTPIIALSLLPEIDNRMSKLVVSFCALALVVQVIAMTIVGIVHVSYRTCLDTDKLCDEALVEWRKVSDKPISYVGGCIYLTSQLSLNLPERPRVYIKMNSLVCPWISKAEVLKKGAVVVTDEEGMMQDIRKEYPSLSFKQMPIELKSIAGKVKHRNYYLAVLKPETEE